MANNVVGPVGNSFAIYASVARTATPDTQEFELPNGAIRGTFVIDCTAASATPSVVFKVSGVDRLSGKAWDILSSAAITGTGTTVMRIAPELTAGTNIGKDVLPSVIRITATHADADSITYTFAGYVA